MKLTDEQADIIDTASDLHDGESLKIDACAGSGKTFTLEQIVKANPDKKFLYLAFNRAIAEECRQRFPENCEVKTVHAFAWQRMRRKFSGLSFGRFNAYDLLPYLKKSRKNAGVYDLKRRTENFLYEAKDHPPGDVAAVLEAMRKGKLPLIHDLYLYDFVKGRGLKRSLSGYDCVLLDEAQDTNPIAMKLFEAARGSRVLVGDSHQSIYAFRHAFNALAKVKAAKQKYLTTCFRCPQGILDQADWFLHRYSIDEGNFPYMTSGVAADRSEPSEPSSAYLTRCNSTLIELIDRMSPEVRGSYRLIRPANEIFSSALAVLAFMNGKTDRLPGAYAFLAKFENIRDIADYARSVHDIELSSAVAIACRFKDKLWDLLLIAKQMNGNDHARNFLCNVYTAKGLQFNEVTLAEDFTDVGKDFTSLTETPEKEQSSELFDLYQSELNLYYVGLTRAEFLISDHTPNSQIFLKEGGNGGYSENFFKQMKKGIFKRSLLSA